MQYSEAFEIINLISFISVFVWLLLYLCLHGKLVNAYILGTKNSHSTRELRIRSIESQHTLVGVDTLGLTTVCLIKVLDKIMNWMNDNGPIVP